MKNNWSIMDKEQIKMSIKDILENDEKFNRLLVDEKNNDKNYSIDELSLKKISKVNATSTCYNEEIAKSIAKIVFAENLETISEWIEKSGFVLKIKNTLALSNIGYEFDEKLNTRKELNNVLITLRKDVEYNTEYGFYIAGIIPIE